MLRVAVWACCLGCLPWGALAQPIVLDVRLVNGSLNLSSPVPIVIREIPLPGGTIIPPDQQVIGRVYEFLPDGLQFGRNITVTMAYQTSDIPQGFIEESGLIYLLYPSGRFEIEPGPRPDGDDFIETVGQALDPIAKRVTLLTRHFSCRALVMGLNPAPTAQVLSAPDGTTLPILVYHKTEKPSPGPDGK